MAGLVALCVVLVGGTSVVEAGVSTNHLRARDDSKAVAEPYITSANFEKVKQMIVHQIARKKDLLAGETTESSFCKEQMPEVKGRLEKQKKIVEAKLKVLDVARKADQKYLDAQLWSAKKDGAKAAADLEKVQAEGANVAALRMARADHPYLLGADAAGEETQAKTRSTFRVLSDAAGALALVQTSDAKPEDPIRETAKDVQSAKYELKGEMKGLENVNKEHEILHNRCVAKLNASTYKERVAARAGEIDNLKTAYDIIDTPAWKRP